jgi:hypothetical protein
MPAFGDLLGQKAAWAIRSYIETRPDDSAMAEHAGRLTELMSMLTGIADKVKGDPAAYEGLAAQVDQTRGELAQIASEIGTLSGAPVADSPASRAAAALDGQPESVIRAAEILTIGLSKAE